MRKFLRLVAFVALLAGGMGIANATETTGESLFLAGNACYERGQYDSASLYYEAILSEGLYNAEVYYNLGNAYYRLKQYPRAILNYERALKVSPRHKNAEFNLSLAQNYIQDKVVSHTESPLRRWFSSIPYWLSERGWGWLSLAGFTLFALFLLAFRFFVPRNYWVFTGVVALLFLLLGVVSLYYSARSSRLLREPSHAVVMQSVVSVKSSPDASSKDLFILHSGTKVNLLDSLGGWYEVRIADGKRGWLECGSVEGI